MPPPSMLDDNENVYKVPASSHRYNSDTDSLYKVPPVNHREFINPAAAPGDHDSIYKVPPPRSPRFEEPGVYDVPPPGGCPRTSVSSSGSRHSHSDEAPEPLPRTSANKLPYHHHHHQVQASHNRQDSIYDHPPVGGGSINIPRDSIYDVPPCVGGGTHLDTYDNPPPRQGSNTAHRLTDVVPPPRLRRPSEVDTAITTESRYINLPSPNAAQPGYIQVGVFLLLI